MTTVDPTDLEKTENGANRDHCPRWPNEVNGEGHAMQSTKPADTTLWVRTCTFCGWIDGEDLDEQRVAAEATGYANACRRLREIGEGYHPAGETALLIGQLANALEAGLVPKLAEAS